MVSDADSVGGTGSEPRPFSPFFWFLNLVAVFAISVADWVIPGVVVGILLSIPIILTSASDDRRIIVVTCIAASAGFILAALFGHGPVTPPAIWVPNRILAFLTLPSSFAIALLLQDRRLQAARSRDAALAANDLTRLLMSLLAHDVRAALALSVQTLNYVQEGRDRNQAADDGLTRDVQARLQRNLTAIDNLLNIARDELAASAGGGLADSRTPVDVAAELAAEVRAFEAEAMGRGKRLHADFSALRDARMMVDPRVLKQAVAILLDNAMRHAVPGKVQVFAARDEAGLLVRVEDDGPGLGRAEGSDPDVGRGLGLALCEALVRRAGGRLDALSNERSGTTFRLRLPVGPR